MYTRAAPSNVLLWIRSPDGVRDVLEPEQHVPGGDGGDVDVALALRLRGLQGQQRHLPDQV